MSISPQQRKILAFPYSKYQALICDGAIRSGKTSIETIAFVDWAMRTFTGTRLAVCGKTVMSATKNIVIPYINLAYAQERYDIRWRRASKEVQISTRDGRRENVFEIFGGKDEASQDLIQGRTLAGALLDEVVLMPQSFVNQALARCSVDGARFFLSCNPSHPEHWFYKEWILEHERHNALYLHFSLEDNPSLSPETLKRYKTMYRGIFYERYILGRWVVAEGLVYPYFKRERHVRETRWEPGRYYISIDYGTNNPFAMELWGVHAGTGVMHREFYYDSRETDGDGIQSRPRRTPEEYYTELERFAAQCPYPVERVIVDPSAADFIETIRRHGVFAVWEADNAVGGGDNPNVGIGLTGSLLQQDRLLFDPSCEATIREFGLYRWSDKPGADEVIKEYDHAMDAMRYFCNCVMWREAGGGEEQSASFRYSGYT